MLQPTPRAPANCSPAAQYSPGNQRQRLRTVQALLRIWRGPPPCAPPLHALYARAPPPLSAHPLLSSTRTPLAAASCKRSRAPPLWARSQLSLSQVGILRRPRARGEAYVDRTSAIADLLASDEAMSTFFARPRKFGKSLTLDVAAEMLAAARCPLVSRRGRATLPLTSRPSLVISLCMSACCGATSHCAASSSAHTLSSSLASARRRRASS